MEEKLGIVYIHINKINKKVYIGQTINKPEYRQGKQGENYKDSPLFQNAIQKYGQDNFDHIILESNIPQSKLNEREIYQIEFYQSYNRDKGYNLNKGGTGIKTEEQKIEQAKKYNQQRKEHPEIAQKSLDGIKKYQDEHPEYKKEVLKKASEKSVEYQKQHPEEHQQRMKKMQEAAKKKTCKAVQCIETGIIYESAREAERQTGIKHYNIGKACNGISQTAGGFHQKFVKREGAL